MFSGRFPSGSRPGGQLGYSLVELVASMLLIAAIAVLALPTYQDFTPHSKLSNDRTPAAAVRVRAEAAASPAPANGEIQDQPVDRLVSKKEPGEEHKQREKVRRQ